MPGVKNVRCWNKVIKQKSALARDRTKSRQRRARSLEAKNDG